MEALKKKNSAMKSNGKYNEEENTLWRCIKKKKTLAI